MDLNRLDVEADMRTRLSYTKIYKEIFKILRQHHSSHANLFYFGSCFHKNVLYEMFLSFHF